MTLEIRFYSQLVEGTGNNDGFRDAKQTLREEHFGKDADSNKPLPQPRRHEVEFIEKSMELIADRPQHNARILTGLMLLEMCIIAKGYKESIFDAIKPDSRTRNGNWGYGSGYFRSLLKTIGITEQTNLEFEEVESLLGTAKEFIISQVYVGAKSENGFIYDESNGKEGHPFATIEELDISSYLTVCADVMHECAIKVVNRNKEEVDKRIQAKIQADYERQPGILKRLSNAAVTFTGNWDEKKLEPIEQDFTVVHENSNTNSVS